mmetsp:Transcript_4555/g.18558  ORF Transcript_4555/g.18558 Transcript_4555/m.18558 type:complete len:709 (-) Transcript_4555:302-2428(-)
MHTSFPVVDLPKVGGDVVRRPLGQLGARARRQGEGGAVRVGVVELEWPVHRAYLTEEVRSPWVGSRGVVVLVDRRADEIPQAAGVDCGEAGVRLDAGKAGFEEPVVDASKHRGQIEEAPGLHGDGAAEVQKPSERVVKGHLIERRARPDGVRRVDEDDVVHDLLVEVEVFIVDHVGASSNEGRGVLVVHRESRVVRQRCRPQSWHVLSRRPHNRRIDLDKVDRLDELVSQHLARDAAVAAADDEYAHVSVRVRSQQRHVRQHFVVPSFIALGTLERAIQHERAAQGDRLDDFDALVRRLFVKDAPVVMVASQLGRPDQTSEPRVAHEAPVARHAAPPHAHLRRRRGRLVLVVVVVGGPEEVPSEELADHGRPQALLEAEVVLHPREQLEALVVVDPRLARPVASWRPGRQRRIQLGVVGRGDAFHCAAASDQKTEAMREVVFERLPSHRPRGAPQGDVVPWRSPARVAAARRRAVLEQQPNARRVPVLARDVERRALERVDDVGTRARVEEQPQRPVVPVPARLADRGLVQVVQARRGSALAVMPVVSRRVLLAVLRRRRCCPGVRRRRRTAPKGVTTAVVVAAAAVPAGPLSAMLVVVSTTVVVVVVAVLVVHTLFCRVRRSRGGRVVLRGPRVQEALSAELVEPERLAQDADAVVDRGDVERREAALGAPVCELRKGSRLVQVRHEHLERRRVVRLGRLQVRLRLR